MGIAATEGQIEEKALRTPLRSPSTGDALLVELSGAVVSCGQAKRQNLKTFDELRENNMVRAYIVKRHGGCAIQFLLTTISRRRKGTPGSSLNVFFLNKIISKVKIAIHNA